MEGRTPKLALLSAVVFATVFGAAAGSERVGDASNVYALQRHGDAEALLEREIGAVIDAAPADDRFDLYRAFNQLSGTWLQIELLDELLHASIAAEPSEEDEVRTTLRDQAAFVLWEIDDAERFLSRDATQRSSSSASIGDIRAFLADVRKTVARLQAEEQARPIVH